MHDEVIPILRVGNIAEAVTWYQRLGFTQEWEHRLEPGLPAFVSIARGPMRLFLSEHDGDARPNTLVYLRVRDVDEFGAKLGQPVEERPWAREVHVRDSDGNRLRIGTPLRPETDST
ncbi:MAG TPA: glyoxalase superfamily protein [Jatrophihabitantaceae bacterium]|jgi:catechol 2,3-dioxygenase-like lactoylglutathione lyase family enzyme